MRIALVGSLALFGLAAGMNAGTLITSTFSANTEGWDTYSFAVLANQYPNFTTAFGGASAVAYNASGGDPGQYISAADTDNGWQYFQAGSGFTGNFASAYGGSLTFNMIRLDPFVSTPISPAGPVVAITNGSLILVYSGSESIPTTAGWSNYLIPLLANGLWNVGDPTGAAATSGQIASVLSNVTGLYILGDWTSGAPGTVNPDQYGLDNVAINSVPTPEPATSVLLGIGLAAIATAGRRRARL
jgi:hypothetical protein